MPDFYEKDLAYVHHVGFREVPEAAARWLVSYLSRHAVPDGAILDLGCGSGIFAAGVARTGRPVIGIDASREMVALAQRTAPEARFDVGSIYEADFPECAVVAIIGEGLNYVPASGVAPPLAKTFGRVRACLLRRGLFVFDVITGPVGALVPRQSHRRGRDWTVVSETRASRQRDRFERHITTFREVRGRYRRSEETHSIQVFERLRVAKALRRAGFAVRATRAYEEDVRLPGRTTFVARKR